MVKPPDSAFLKQAELAQAALKTFTTVQFVKSTAVVKAAIAELVDSTVLFNSYVPGFVSHPLFQEIPPSVFHVLEKFFHKHPNFDVPINYAKIAGLDARVRDSLNQPPSFKNGMCLYSFLPSFPSHPFLFSDLVAPTGPRADKGKKNKTTVRPLYLFPFFSLSYLFLGQASSTLQGVR